jgi:hypothetical protein
MTERTMSLLRGVAATQTNRVPGPPRVSALLWKLCVFNRRWSEPGLEQPSPTHLYDSGRVPLRRWHQDGTQPLLTRRLPLVQCRRI